MKISNRFALFVILFPLILLWSINVVVLNEYNERMFLYWDLTFVSIVGLFFFTWKNWPEILRLLSSHDNIVRKLVICFVVLYFTGLIATFTSKELFNFTIKQFIQSSILYFIAILSLVVGNFYGAHEDVQVDLKVYVISAAVLSLFFYVSEFSDMELLAVIVKRPFTLSFYFIPVLSYFLLVSKIRLHFVIPALFWFTYLMLLSGSRSGTLLQFALMLSFYLRRRNTRMLLLFFTFVLVYFIDFSWLSESRINNLDTPRDLIWEEVITRIHNSQNYIIGNGFLRPTLETYNENVSSAHNTFLQLIYSVGTVGLLVGIYMLIVIFLELKNINLIFALSFLSITWVNDISVFPIDYSRMFEYIFFIFFIGFASKRNKWESQY